MVNISYALQTGRLIYYHFRTPFGEYPLQQDIVPHATTGISNVCLQGAPTTKSSEYIKITEVEYLL